MYVKGFDKKWIEYTEEENEIDNNKRLIGGYLKEYSYFDAEKFYEITGINID